MKQIYPDGAVILAPIAGHSDVPMRLSARRHGCRFAFTEMVDAGSLVYQTTKSLKLLERDPAESFLGVQLVGSDLPMLRKATELLNDREFDVLDFNLGCPAPKVAKKGEGITLALKRPDDALRALETLVKYSRFPVSVKTRIQNETDAEPTVRFCRRLEDAGASALTLHGRVMKVFYSGPVFYRIISEVRENLGIQVIANGGGLTKEAYGTLLRESGCSCGMIARGALGNPWIFSEIQENAAPPTVREFASELETHVHAMMEFYGVECAMRICRKTILEYLRGRGFPAQLRAGISFLRTPERFETLMMEIRRGPSQRYWEFIALHPEEAERKLTPEKRPH